MIVVLHGWSDSAQSFAPLVRRIRAMAIDAVEPIHLGDYVTMDDDVQFDDLVRAMQRAWLAAKLPTAPRTVDLVVHSTGALVARYWMTQYFRPETNPVRRLAMLAPANFGSHLAHKGTSFLGRVTRGFRSRRLFHTGAAILHVLELASPFSARLAMLDRFDPGARWYGRDRVLATALVGTAGYTGIAAAANTAGSDGTVLVSTANLDPARLVVDFASDPSNPTSSLHAANGGTAFCRLPGENHSTVACKDGGPRNARTLDLLRAALTVTDAGFDDHVAALARESAAFRAAQAGDPYAHGFQNTVIAVRDDQGREVDDYFIEFFVKQAARDAEDPAATERFQREALRDVHTNRQAPSRRAFKFDCDVLLRLLADLGRPLNMSITASPEIRDTKSVGYSTIAYDDIGSLAMRPPAIDRVFVPDRTLLLDLTLRREQVADLVTFAAAKA